MGNGLFGDLEVDEIPDDVFYIEPNTYYRFIVTKVQWEKYEPNDGTETVYYNTTYVVNVDDPESDYNGKPVQQRFSRYPDLTREDFENLGAPEKQQILNNMSRHKAFLSGLGLSETEINTCGDSEEANIEATLQRQFTAKYVVNTSEGKGGNKRTYRNLQNMKPVTDEPEDSTTAMAGFEF